MISPAEALAVPLLGALEERLRDRIVARAADVRVSEGEWFLFEGDPAAFWIVIEGEVEVNSDASGRLEQMTTFDPGEFFGEVPLMLGAASFRSCRALSPSRLMRLDRADFHMMVAESSEASAIIAQTVVRRVGLMSEKFVAESVNRAQLIGGQYDTLCHDLRDFLSRNQVPFEWLDSDDESDRSCIPEALLKGDRLPAVVIDAEHTLVQPDLRRLADALGLQTQPDSETYDVVIIGGGPAGLASAVYGGSEGLKTIMIEREAPGGQAGTSSRIENYLGFPGGISGGNLAHRALQQARRFGTEILVTREVAELRPVPGMHDIVLDGNQRIQTRAVVLATGVAWRTLTAKGVMDLIGRGVYFGASATEALETRGHAIFLVGGGNSAGQAAVFFSNYARAVTLLVRRDSLEATMSHYLIEQIRSKKNVHVELGVTVERAIGTSHLEAIVTRDADGAEQTRPAAGLFMFIGADAQTRWLPPGLERDARGYLLTGRSLETWAEKRRPFALETNIPGIFAAGDVRSDSVKRVASGVGEGSMVIAYVHQYLETLTHATA
jgi:thioredoxin reductase (NADPH)